MTTNESTPNVPRPIDPASQIALAVLARFFDERQSHMAAIAESLRAEYPAEYPEQNAIAHGWKCAANTLWDVIGGRPNGSVHHGPFVKIGVTDLGKLIAMATAWQESPANECSNSERTQYELTIAQQQSKIAELTANVEQMENANLRTVPYIEELLTHKEAMRNQIVELQARIDELTKVPVADGQTPGQLAKATFMRVTYNHHESDSADRWALVASEVLRVFGKCAAVLQRVRSRIGKILLPPGEDPIIAAMRIIDEELAALAPANSPATP